VIAKGLAGEFDIPDLARGIGSAMAQHPIPIRFQAALDTLETIALAQSHCPHLIRHSRCQLVLALIEFRFPEIFGMAGIVEAARAADAQAG
jgi:hypothetical protein